VAVVAVVVVVPSIILLKYVPEAFLFGIITIAAELFAMLLLLLTPDSSDIA